MSATTSPFDELPPQENPEGERGIPIKIIGLGGAGISIVSRLQAGEWEQVRLAAADTDRRTLERASSVPERLLIGRTETKGLSSGGDPECGRKAAEAAREELKALSEEAELLFLVCGLGGGTGGNAATVLAEEAGKRKALVIAFAVMPFSFEGGRRTAQAQEALGELREACDAVIPLANDAVLQVIDDDESVREALARSDEWVQRGIRSIWSMLFLKGLMPLDYAGLRRVFKARGGRTIYSLGCGDGEQKLEKTVETLRSSPLTAMPDFARKADRLLVNIIGGPDLSMREAKVLMEAVTEQFGRDVDIIMGAVAEESMSGRLEVAVLGVSDTGVRKPRPLSASRAESQQDDFPGKGARKRRKSDKSEKNQGEFDLGSFFTRGYFDRTGRNLYQGEDLDTPTFQRRGIKLVQ